MFHFVLPQVSLRITSSLLKFTTLVSNHLEFSTLVSNHFEFTQVYYLGL